MTAPAVEGAYPPPFYPDPLLSNVNFRPMPGDEAYYHGPADGYETPTDLHREGGVDFSDQPDDEPEQESKAPEPEAKAPEPKAPAPQSKAKSGLTAPTEVTAEALGNGEIRLSAVVPSDQQVHKLVFYVDGKQVAVVEDEGGLATTDVQVGEGEHSVRAFTYTGDKSGPWSETVSVTA